MGLAVYPLAALVNHSCDYNAVVIFDYSKSLRIHALRAIARGEQIVISYIDSTYPRHVRQKELQDRYFFACECSKCSNELIKHEAIPEGLVVDGHLLVEHRAFELLALARKDTSISGPIQKLQYGIHILRKTDAWPLHHQPLAALRQDLVVALIAADQLHLAFLHAWMQYRSIDKILMPEKHHPIRLVHHWLVAVLLKRIQWAQHRGTRDLPHQKYSLLGRSIDLQYIFYYVIRKLFYKIEDEIGKSTFADWVCHIYSQDGGRWDTNLRFVPKDRFLAEADKLNTCTDEILERELVWGDPKAS